MSNRSRGLVVPVDARLPVDVLTGAVTAPAAIIRGIGMQALWLAVWWLAYRVIWWRGLRRYGAVGG